jgi:predicted nucleic acid-binding protein
MAIPRGSDDVRPYGACYATFIPDDADHEAATLWIEANRGQLLTTDYIIDETLTLLRARGQHEVALVFGTQAFTGILASLHYLTAADIASGWDVFRRFGDKEWSFTDCKSKVVIESLGMDTAFSFDQHFRQFGTVAVVP